MALTLPTHGNEKWLLLSVAVDRAFRGRGIGTQLMEAADVHSRAAGCRRLTGNYSTLTAARAAVEGLLRGRGWSEPGVEELRWHCPLNCVAKAEKEWEGLRRRALARGFRTVPWSNLEPRALGDIAALTQAPGFDPGLNPFRLKDAGSRSLSLGLFQHDLPVGWIVGEFRTENQTGHYPVGYVIPRLQHLGWLIVGILEAARHQARRFGPHTAGLFASLPKTPKMLAFMSRRLAPVFISGFLETRFWSEKILIKELPDDSSFS